MKLRRILLCLLAFLTASVGLASAVAEAQSDEISPSAAVAEKRALNAEAFVMYMNDRGEVACREATADERRRIMGRTGESNIIYAGAPRRRTSAGEEDFSPSAPGNSTLPALQPSAGLRIVLHGTSQLEQNQEAKNAFIVAANRWEAIISTPITIVFDVDFGTNFFGTPFPSANILGQTGTSRISSTVSNVRTRLLSNNPTAAEQSLYNALPVSTVPVEFSGATSNTQSVRLARPNARALGIVPDISNPDSLTIGQGDAGIGFNSAFQFDFNPDDGISAGKTDFDSVATHEMGHALGFIAESGGDNASPLSVWDLFRFRPGITLGAVGSAARVMSPGGSQVFFDNQTNSFNSQELELSTGGPSGDATGGDGNQSSHWKADEQTGRYIGIMDPTLRSGVRKALTDNDVKAIDAFGYSIGGAAPPPPPPPAAPANDNFANAVVLQGPSGSVAGGNTSATREAGEPLIAGNAGGRSVWFFWTAPSTGTATFDTVSSDFDTLLGVYTGAGVGALSLIGDNDDIVFAENVQSRVTFNATGGVTYRIVVDGFNDDSGAEVGNILLHWSGPAATPTPTPTPIPTPTPTPTPAPQFATVTGRVMEGAQGLQGVLVGFYSGQTGALLQQMTTGVDGKWSFSGAVIGQANSVFFVKSGYSFSPPGLAFPINVANQDMGDVAATKGNPIDATDFYVTKHYEDFLGRSPDSSGLNFWMNNIESCGLNLQCRDVKRIDTSAAFFLSIEFQETGFLVYRAYQVAFGNAFDPTIPTQGSPQGYPVPVIRRSEFLADTPLISQGVQVGIGNWEQQLETNKQVFMQNFVGRQRFTDAYPLTMNADAFVTRLDQNAGGILSSVEKTTLVNVFGGSTASSNDAAKRAQVLRSIAEHATLRQNEKNRAFVLMQYYGYLRRDPNTGPNTDYVGYKFWLDKLNSFGGDFRRAEMVKAFLSSSEYRGRFGQP